MNAKEELVKAKEALLHRHKLLGKQEKEIKTLKHALQWCSGSSDFGVEGKAREGWLKICQPLIFSN